MNGKTTVVLTGATAGIGRALAHALAARDVVVLAKWAIEGLTRGLALELPSDLAAVALSPGVVDTAMLRACLPDVAAPTPEAWARLAAPQLLALDRRHNGRSITISA
ncbi:hypothetical protein [Nannocystis sp. SCPEA4]|uniref:hypothetical protein n=1 Tax=Nannocystis sp. SCPEA4 TaxID=2996787 RepID=UPI002270010D|nr:hypothetical protein [Nannocystis sp. SCPEA4]MCY1054983.1 hypothetical protein [Nannocystis sp. SCPEA4]